MPTLEMNQAQRIKQVIGSALKSTLLLVASCLVMEPSISVHVWLLHARGGKRKEEGRDQLGIRKQSTLVQGSLGHSALRNKRGIGRHRGPPGGTEQPAPKHRRQKWPGAGGRARALGDGALGPCSICTGDVLNDTELYR